MKKSIFLLLSFVVLVGGLLRIYKISTIPPGLYIDEISIGLNAYDILKTGKDQYGVSHPLLFKSLGDWKVPGYIYMVSGSMAIFGKDEFAVRFPSFLAGTLTILVIFFLTREILGLTPSTRKQKDSISLIAAAILSITPWHVHFSRGGFEAIVSLFLYLLALYFAIIFWQKKKMWQILLVVVLLIGAFYTYDAYRIIVPLTALVGFVWGIRSKVHRKEIVLAGILLFVGALPLFASTLTGVGQTRFLQTSAFSEDPYTSGIAKVLGDGVIFIRNFLSYFSITYLFRFGDQINRHQVNDLGILYVWQLPFILAGILFLTKAKNKLLNIFIVFFLVIGAITASIARPSPHTIRFLMGCIPYTILTSLGIFQLFTLKNKWVRFVCILVGIFAIIEIGYYFNYYYVDYPKEALIDWGGACKETAYAIDKQSPKYQYIVIDKNLSCIKEYFLFYIPNIQITYVDTSWTKPKGWGSTLYVRPFYGKNNPDGLVENVTLPNLNHDIFAQLINL